MGSERREAHEMKFVKQKRTKKTLEKRKFKRLFEQNVFLKMLQKETRRKKQTR